MPILIILCLAATWIIWGSTYLAIRFALLGFPPLLQMGTRFLLAGVLVAAWMRWVRKAPWPNPTQWRNALVIGTLMLVVGMGCTAVAEQWVPSGMVVAFVAASPVSMAILGRWLMGTRTTRLEGLGIAVGLIGVAALTQGGSFQASPWGLFLIILASTSWALGSILSQRHFPLAPGAMGFASEMLIGSAILTVVSVWRGEWSDFLGRFPPSPTALAAWLYLVVAGSLIAFNAYMVLLARASPALAGSYAFVNPVIGLLLGVSVGNEVVSPLEWAASTVILLGVILVVLGRRRGAT
jgi:drug/metabolite transporter (DMT)-like permease